ncbi:hypothetical protein LRS03_13540 [Rhizobacter sp. J219]|uniref:hypothetical protein n=1 Tax=Rhizobacter sp. J219 TaxID=2898430 RepID=UPI00215178DA|nr:hypothetical protein [Rhizobacter sp. J219]MCR5883823.1 hypothetical protein [Rhizobacter sp. J219]
MANNKEQLLAVLYREMSTDEIERRLAHADLVDVARRLAADELTRRRTAAPETATSFFVPDVEPAPRDGARIAKLFVGIAVFAAAAWVLLPKELAGLLIVGVSLPAFAVLIGKLAPGPSPIIGFILLATPLWLGALMWHSGDLAWRSGDYRPLWSLIMWAALIVGSLMGMCFGSSLMFGARHEESWKDIEQELGHKRKDALARSRHLD